MTRQELINMVKTKVDELSPLDDIIVGVSSINDKPIDSFADSLLDESAKELMMNVPLWRLGGTSLFLEVIPNKDGSGYVYLPEDFLRLIAFKMKEWERPVTDVVEEGSPLGKMQSNKYLRGGICKPICVIGHLSGFRILKYYSVNRNHELDNFTYAKILPAEDVPVDLQDILTWWCASRILQIVGKSDLSKIAYERGLSIL